MNIFKKVGSKVFAEGADLVTIPNVPIVATGIDYPLAQGSGTFTEEDLVDAVRAAEEDPNIQHPRLKLAYGGPHQEQITEPAFGTVANLRFGDNNQIVYGDLVGVPRWLAEVLPTAYPSRSIEANRNIETVGGKKYRLVLNNVALLGVHLPGVTSLPDLANYYGSKRPEGVVIDGLSEQLAASSVNAEVNIDDVRRKYYEGLGPDQSWWWIRSMKANDGYIIVDDDQGNLYRVEYEVNGEEVSFGEAQQVKIEYQDVPKQQVAASVVAGLAALDPEMTVYATRAESRPETATKEGGNVDLPALAKRLGLPEDATEEQINAAMDAKLGKVEGDPAPNDPGHEGPSPEPATPSTPGTTDAPAQNPGGPSPAGPPAEDPATDDEGFVRLDKETYEQLAASGKEASEFIAGERRKDREHIVVAAIKDGKIAPKSRENFLRMFENDPDGTKKLLTASVEDGGLAAGSIPVEARGSGGTPSGNEDVDGLPDEWFGGAIAASRKRADGQSRVTMAKEA